MNEPMRRLLQAVRFERDAFVWMDFNDRATGDALIFVIVTRLLILLASGWSILGLATSVGGIETMVQAAINVAVFWLVYSGLVYATARFLLGGGGAYATTLRITGFAYPTLLLTIATGIIIPNALLSGSWQSSPTASGTSPTSPSRRRPWRPSPATSDGSSLRASSVAASSDGHPAEERSGDEPESVTSRGVTYRIDLAYDGTGFHGYAIQASVRTVQGVLEHALRPHIGDGPTVVAGRTDRGVHATGQVVSFVTNRALDTDLIRRSLNRRLGPEIAVSSITRAPDGFSARFSATGRAYTYLVVDGDTPDPFLANRAWQVGWVLDVDRMNTAAAHFVGTHDFASFCRKAPGRSTMRSVRSAVWTRRRPDLLAFDVAASSFCHQMVRSLVAVCVDVGRGLIEPDAVPAMLAARDRNASRGASPPHGLTLVSVEYEGSGMPSSGGV